MKRTIGMLAGIAAVVGAMWVIAAEDEAATEQQESEAENRYSELVEEKGEFRKTYVLPGVDPSKYKKIFFWDGQQFYGIAEEDRAKFEESVGEAFRKELVRAKQFEIIENLDEVDTSTLIARGALLDIVSRVPPEMIGRSDVYLSSIGEATFVIELMDAENGHVVALAAERRSIETLNARSGAMVPANSASIMGDIRRWAGNLARRLRNALDKAIKEANKA
jgi:hypothetical protein